MFSGYLIMAGPLPARAVIHFSSRGIPTNYGSTWLAFGLAIGMSAFYILLSFLIDELWARQETVKTFNWMSLFDEVITGGLLVISVAYLQFVKQDGQAIFIPWMELLMGIFIMAFLAVVLELARPFKQHWQQITSKDTSALQAELAKKLPGSAPLIFWEVQNPLYVKLLATLAPLAMFIGAVISWFTNPVATVILVVCGGFLALFHGGQRTIVTRRDIKVRYGILGIKPFHLRISDIAVVEMHSFAPLRDFGGYGIRFNRELKAYFLSGSRGVKLTTSEGKKYLIGSDHPERLTAVLQAVAKTHLTSL